MVKVSVVVPVYNTEKYLRQCLDSLMAQTLKEIEVICVNDGSYDSSLSIITEYVERDRRFKAINKENSGYGASMNMGFQMASGEYIGILESDDYIEPHMLETLYSKAKADSLDVCKCGFFYYHSLPQARNIEARMTQSLINKGVFCPLTDLKSPKAQLSLFGIKPTIWSAIYKREFIRGNEIRFTETPGASFQDTAFNFKVWALAKKVRLIKPCLIHYRQDNELSSVNSRSKAFFICTEYSEIESFLDKHPQIKNKLEPIKNALKYDAYMWNYERLDCEIAGEFILSASRELSIDMEKGSCLKKLYPWHKWNQLRFIISDPLEFHRLRQSEKSLEASIDESERQGGRLKTIGASVKKNGLGPTLKALTMKIKRRLLGK